MQTQNLSANDVPHEAQSLNGGEQNYGLIETTLAAVMLLVLGLAS